jgi:hypothetical protein
LNTLVRLNDVVMEKFKKSALNPKKNVTVDSSGLGIRRRRKRAFWYSIRTHSNPSKKEKRDFRKLHLARECNKGREKPIYSFGYLHLLCFQARFA